jgi:glycosyltransferase involved in cell wall biosynthesis
MNKVSAVIIAYNEEQNLQLSLPKLSWCDEIIVVDSGSTDGTLDICRAYNCKIYHKKFNGYGAQKQYAVSLTNNNWVLCLDADEVLSDGLVTELKTEMRNPSVNGYLIPMKFIFLGKQLKYGREKWRYYIRLFNKTKGGFTSHKVHEKINIDGDCQKLSNYISHYSYRSFSQCIDKINRYSSYGAQVAYKNGKKKSLTAILFALPLNFLKYYFFDRNFLNGMNGFYWSVINAIYHFAKYTKLRELYQANKALDLWEKEMRNNTIKTKIFSQNLKATYPVENT